MTLTFDLMTLTSIGVLCHPGWTCGSSLRRVGKGVLELLDGNGFGTFDPVTLTFDPVTPKATGIPLLPRRDVWTKFEEGRSSCSRVIDQKRKG